MSIGIGTMQIVVPTAGGGTTTKSEIFLDFGIEEVAFT